MMEPAILEIRLFLFPFYLSVSSRVPQIRHPFRLESTAFAFTLDNLTLPLIIIDRFAL